MQGRGLNRPQQAAANLITAAAALADYVHPIPDFSQRDDIFDPPREDPTSAKSST